MSFQNKTILVTGAAGFIGSHLCDALIDKGVKKIIGFDNMIASDLNNVRHLLKNKKFELIKGDIRDYDIIEQYVLGSDAVFNLAASKMVASMEKPRLDLETNIIGIFNILQAARKKRGIKIIHASTGSVLGSSDKPMDEKHPTNPTTLYGISKLAGEKYCLFYNKEFGVNASVIRYFHVFGPRQDFNGKAGVINIFLSRILQNKPPVIYGTGEQMRCFTFVLDDVEATLMLARNKNTFGNIYNVASETRISVKDLANLLIKKYAKNKNMKTIYKPVRPGENLRPIPNTAKIEKLGFKQKYKFEEALEITKKWVENELRYDRK